MMKKKVLSLVIATVFSSLTILISGCTMTINATDNTKFDISAGQYYINGTGVVDFAGVTGVDLTYLLTDLVTWIAFDQNGSIIQKALEPFTNEQRRQYAILGLFINLIMHDY